MEVLESKIIRAESAAIPEIKNNPPKLLRLWLVDEMEVPESGQLLCLPNHAFSIFFILPHPVKFSIALDISGTRREPLGKT